MINIAAGRSALKIQVSASALAGWAVALSAASATAQDPAPRRVLHPSAETQRGWCGTVLTDADIDAELERQAAGDDVGGGSRGADYTYVRLAFHVVRTSAGTGGISIADIQAAVDVANNHFFASRIVLVPMHLDFINSDTYYTLTEPEDDALRQVNVIPGALNIYFVDDAPYCGEATFPGDSIPGIVMQNSCTGDDGVLSHEIGHYFNLWHTHETAAGADCPGNPNCGSDGDLCCDTPPDPGLHTCSSPTNPGSCVSGCEYDGTATCNGVAYAPDVTNTMSYTDFECMDGFSDNQRARVANALTLSDRVDEIIMQHPCPIVTFTALGSPFPIGTWLNPMPSVRSGIALSSARCGPLGGGVLRVRHGVYHEGTAVFNTPVTITRDGIAGMIEIRP
jgi:Pregnancy-associated plasma protein-A